MIFSIKQEKDNELEREYRKSVKELNSFFKLNYTKYLPKIILIPNRRTIDLLYGEKTEDWVVGWTREKTIWMLNKKNYEKESNHKYTKEEYVRLMKHELVHIFTNVFLKKRNIDKIPSWFSEGIAIYLSGQYKIKKIPLEFSEFLKFHNKSGRGVYKESGFFIEFLIKKYKKEKFLKFFKSLNKINYSKKEFNKNFKKYYKFDLDYKMINKIFKESLKKR